MEAASCESLPCASVSGGFGSDESGVIPLREHIDDEKGRIVFGKDAVARRKLLGNKVGACTFVDSCRADTERPAVPAARADLATRT